MCYTVTQQLYKCIMRLTILLDVILFSPASLNFIMMTFLVDCQTKQKMLLKVFKFNPIKVNSWVHLKEIRTDLEAIEIRLKYYKLPLMFSSAGVCLHLIPLT